MKLQGRNLKPNIRGEDVKLLQSELRRLGFDVAETDGFFDSTLLLAVQAFQRRHRIDPANGVVDKETARLINEAVDDLDVDTRVVLGNVLREDGSPVTDARMRAFDKGIRQETMLGQARTDDTGHYEIRYSPQEDAVCLVVHATAPDGAELAASDVIFGAQPVETVDLVVGARLRGPSEFTRLETKLLPALAQEDIRPVDVTAEEAEFIARKYALDLQHLGHYVLAARLQEDTDLPRAIYYGLFRQNFPTRLPALLAQDPVVLRGALETALDENIISADLRDILDRVLDWIQHLIVRHAFRPPEIEGTFSLNDLLNTTGLSRDQQAELLTRYVRREGTVEEFWQELEDDPSFGRERVREAQFALQLATVTKNHLPLVEALRREEITSTRELVRLTEADWLALVRHDRGGGGVVGTPPEIPGEVEEEKQTNYAKVLEAIVEDAFPTGFLAARLSEDEDDIIEGKGELLTFLDRNPDFEFERTKVDSYLRQHGDSAFEGVEDQERLTQNLKTVRRLAAVAPRNKCYGVIKPLLQAGLTSAHSIARKGSAAVALLTETVGEEQAQAVLNRASHRSAMAQTLFAEFSPSMHRALPQAIFPGIQPAESSSNGMGRWIEALPTDDPDLPNWETLFGNIDFCACEHCQSVLSPAAYLVDILAFVVDQELREAFRFSGRRGDVGNIELNCANTNTPLPYIDLVNEILENAIAPSSEARQTTWTAEELRAQPEHRNDRAYTQLADAVHPWLLPFSLPHEEAWRYLDHLGVQRYQLMDALRQEGGDPSDVEIAADHLHVTPLDSAIIARGPDLDHTLSELWGLPDLTLNDLRAALRHIPTFLKHTELKYSELLERLSLRFINPTGSQRVEFEDIAVCDLDTADFFNPLSEPFLDRFHRFERLRRKLDWSGYYLDRAIAALAPEGELTGAFLIHLSAMKQLRERLPVEPVEMLSWWSTIDTRTYTPEGLDTDRSLYEQRFQNKIAFDSNTLAFFALNTSGTELAGPGQSVEDHLSSLTAALSVSADDIFAVTKGVLNDLDLDTISRLFRHASLAKALGVPVRDLVSLREVSGVNPFANPSETLHFLDIAAQLQRALLGVPSLLFLLWHEERPGGQGFLPDATIGAALNGMRTGIQTIYEETELPDELRELTLQETPDEAVEQPTPTAGPFEAFTERQLGKLLEGEDLSQALALIRGDAPEDPEAFIVEHLPFLDPEDALSRLVGQEGEAPELDPGRELVQRLEYVLTPLLTHLRRILSEAHIVQTFAAEFGLPVGTAERLLVDILIPSQEGAERIMDDFLLEDFVTSIDDLAAERTADDEEFTADVHAVQFQSFTRLWKAATIIATLGLTSDELSWLDVHGPALDLLDLNALPVGPLEGEVLPNLFPGLARLLDLVNLRNGLPPSEPTLFELIEPALTFDPVSANAGETELSLLNQLHERTGWDLDTLTFLASSSALDLTYPDAYRDGHAIRRLQAAIEHLKRLGLTAPEVVPAWIQGNLIAEAAQQIKATVKAKFDTKQWLSIAQAINDELREKQRDALLAFLIVDENRPFESANEAYGWFLIDPEMSACMLTARIKQAISSVQLFIQRVLLNLEGGELSLSNSAVETWNTWMKQYRVWEANRLVFLYPENWIEPELRDDKSPFFAALETELLQSAISEETVETAFRHYLEKLQEVSRLEIAGIYSENSGNIHHVFARTPDNPHVYFYRRWHFPKYWTPWERVDLDIEGDHLIPVVLKNRLFLFWPVFTEKPVDEDPPQEEGSAGKPKTYLEITLAWSEYKGDSWSAKTVSNTYLVFPWQYLQAFKEGLSPLEDVKSLIYLRSIVSGREVTIKCVSAEGGADGFYGYHIGQFTFSLVTSSAAVNWNPNEVWFDPHPISPVVGAAPRYMTAVEQSEDVLELRTTQAGDETLVLRETPGTFRIAYPHQYNSFYSQSPFFYEDSSKTFAVYPFDVPEQHGGPGAPDPELTVGIRTTHNTTPDAVDRVTPLFATLILGDREAGDGESLELVPEDPALDDLGLEMIEEASAPRNPLRTEIALVNASLPAYNAGLEKRFRFYTFYHPYVHLFLSQLRVYGLSGLLGGRGLFNASIVGGPTSFFEDRYGDPLPHAVLPSYPIEDVTFQRDQAYSSYNWELFFHAPLLIADRLRQDQRFEEALRWFHYLFDPTDCMFGNPPQCYWKIKPFLEYDLSSPNAKPIQELLKILSQGSRRFQNQVQEWRDNPFNPHAIARLRTIAYQKTVVMKYLDTLIAWGDQLFRRDTIESINEAAQLYILAAEILGPRPTELPSMEAPPVQTFNSIEPLLDPFSNALIEIENHLSAATMEADVPGGSPPPLGAILYSCIPENDKLLSYWDTVGDRLFKIRHCMNIEGVVRELPLFEPPIDPGLLVKATAAGLDISSAINDLSAPLPHYRFHVLAQKASELANEVKSLGAAFLSTLEKRDAEELALLRATLEIQLLDMAEGIKNDQLTEASEAREALNKAKDLAVARGQYYIKLLSADVAVSIADIDIADVFDVEGLGLNKEELMQLGLAGGAAVVAALAMVPQLAAGITSLVPTFSFGVAGAGGSPLNSISFGGGNVSGAASAASALLQQGASVLDRSANIAGIIAGYRRRADEWTHQMDQADGEMLMIQKQIDAADIRIAIAEKEIKQHKKQIEQAKQIRDFMESKYTNQELYSWMISQLTTVYFQSYQLAYDVAKRAERAFQHELGVTDTNYIQFGYWDNLKKGLISGEKLYHDLKRMEVAYLEQNRRELEITKHVSLMLLNPVALLQLKEQGSCEINLPEMLFDLDFPGHYMRRIKSVSITIPCVTGPYTSVSGTLTLLKHSVRTAPNLNDPLQETFGAVQSIATSSAQNDSGLFELNFRDERYLPFEGAGAISTWRLELPAPYPQFDYKTISDAVFHINYTARDGGTALRDASTTALKDTINEIVRSGDREGWFRLFSARHEFPTQWHRFLHPLEGEAAHTLSLQLSAELFPFIFRNLDFEIDRVELILPLAEGTETEGTESAVGSGTRISLVNPGGTTEFELQPSEDLGGLLHAEPDPEHPQPTSGLGDWTLEVIHIPDTLRVDGGNRLNPEAIADIGIICHYKVSEKP